MRCAFNAVAINVVFLIMQVWRRHALRMVKSVAWPRARVRAVLMWRKQKKKPTSPTDCVHLMPLSGA